MSLSPSSILAADLKPGQWKKLTLAAMHALDVHAVTALPAAVSESLQSPQRVLAASALEAALAADTAAAPAMAADGGAAIDAESLLRQTDDGLFGLVQSIYNCLFTLKSMSFHTAALNRLQPPHPSLSVMFAVGLRNQRSEFFSWVVIGSNRLDFIGNFKLAVAQLG